MILHGYSFIDSWEGNAVEKYTVAEKNGDQYVLKQYQTPVSPLDNGALDDKVFLHNERLFESFVGEKLQIFDALQDVDSPCVPCDAFVYDRHFIEVYKKVDCIVDKDEVDAVLAGLSFDKKEVIMLSLASSLASFHKRHIVHGNITNYNISLFINSTGNYVAKFVDFNSSFFVNRKPEEFVGCIDYFSPEIGAYAEADNSREVLKDKITEKTDVFSAGLVFHYCLCGELPVAINLTDRLQMRKDKGKVIYCWKALNEGCQLQINSDIPNAFAELIRDMLRNNPYERPSAKEVLTRLKEIGLVEDKLDFGVISNTKMSSISDSFDVWDDHHIEFDIERIKSRGFVTCRRKMMAGIKGYDFFKSDSSSVFLRLETLLSMGFAKTK